jgi:hypothetical protein
MRNEFKIMCMYNATMQSPNTMQPIQPIQPTQSKQNTLVIEAWLHPLSALTPSLILHNLGLQGIQVNETGMTVSIDRGHYDCTGANYARIVVRTKTHPTNPTHPTHPTHATHPTHPPHATHPTTFCCSFFSQKATVGMDSTELHSHWLGNCYVHLDDDKHVSGCSYRHESGHAKTWRKAIAHVNEANEDQDQDQDQDNDAVSVEPCPPRPSPRTKINQINQTNSVNQTNNNKANAKDHLRIIQLQKQNFLLRTELDDMRGQLGAMRAEMEMKFEAMQMRQNEQEVWIKRANQCMQDWTNRQVIERVWILETQHAVLRSEHLKQKEQQQEQRQQEQRLQREQVQRQQEQREKEQREQEQRQQEQREKEQREQEQRQQEQREKEQRQQEQPQPQKLKCKCKCKSLLKKQKTRH